MVSVEVMSERAMTRRTLLAAGAGALAGSVMRPQGALATLAGPPQPRMSDRDLGSLPPGTPVTVRLASRADLVGLQWHGPAQAGLQLRVLDAAGRWGRWVSAGAHGHGPEGRATGSTTVGDPIWTGGVRELQVRAERSLSGVRLHLVDVSAGAGARRLARGWFGSSAALALAAPRWAAGPGQPPVIARRVWAQGTSRPRVTPEYGAVRVAFVHHTENPNGYLPGEVPAMLRAIYAFHRYIHGWNDIGYNFVVDLYGRIFEARAGGIDEPVVGAHAGGYNLVSSGVAVLGSFTSVPISAPARTALEALLAWKLSLHGVPSLGRVTVKVNPAGASYSRFPANARVSLPRIAGHRDGDSTDCPGSVLYGELPSIRARVHALVPVPARLTLALAPPTPTPVPPVPPGQPAPPVTAPAPGQGLQGVLSSLAGQPIAGAKVLVQSRTVGARGEAVSEQTIAEAVTDSQGAWMSPGAFSAARRGGTSLRAVYAGAPGSSATISESLHVTVQGTLNPPAAPAPTQPAAQPPSS